MPGAHHWQLDPNFRTNPSGGRDGRFVPISDFCGAIRFRDAVDHVGDAQRSSDARTTGPWPSVLMQIKADFLSLFYCNQGVPAPGTHTAVN
jgi:hypothetical protein